MFVSGANYFNFERVWDLYSFWSGGSRIDELWIVGEWEDE